MAKLPYIAKNAILPDTLCNLIMETVMRPDMEIIKQYKFIDFYGQAEQMFVISKRDTDSTIMTITSRTGRRTLNMEHTDIKIGQWLALSVDDKHPFISKLIQTCDARTMEMGRIGTPKHGITPTQIAAIEYLKSITR